MPFFQNFPRIGYNFGDETTPALFQDLSVYIDIIDQIADDGSFYEFYTIVDGDRPDTVSYKIYGTTEFYWTFYLLNEKIRTGGWPLTNKELYEEAEHYYPNITLTTEEEMFDYFLVGQTIVTTKTNYDQNDLLDTNTVASVINNPDGRGTIIERNLDLGQLVIRPDNGIDAVTITNAGNGYFYSPAITITGGGGSGASLSAEINSSGNITGFNILKRGSGYTSPPTITIEPPTNIKWSAVDSDLSDYLDLGASSVPVSIKTLFEKSIDGYSVADINNDGTIDSDDLSTLVKFISNRSSVTSDERTWLEGVFTEEIISQYEDSAIQNYFPGGIYDPSTATATASLFDQTDAYVGTKWMFTEDDTYEQNTANWTISDVRFNAIGKSQEQFNATHHYENTDEEWVDINPFKQGFEEGDSDSTISLIPITYLERFKEKNDDLKVIKVFKPDVVIQINNEFQKQLRNN